MIELPKVWTPGVDSWCEFSFDRTYRYSLTRCLSYFGSGRVVCVGLNPSTADETSDDNTIRLLARRAYAAGFAVLIMTNLFAFRATDPGDMKRSESPVGDDNDAILRERFSAADQVIICWGAHGSHMNRAAAVLEMLKPHMDKVYCFGRTKRGEPKHPLYLRKDTPLVKWTNA